MQSRYRRDDYVNSLNDLENKALAYASAVIRNQRASEDQEELIHDATMSVFTTIALGISAYIINSFPDFKPLSPILQGATVYSFFSLIDKVCDLYTYAQEIKSTQQEAMAAQTDFASSRKAAHDLLHDLY
jgi:hypothetical protein